MTVPDSPAPGPSYALDRAAELSSELSRLERQAAVPFALEYCGLAKHGMMDAARLLDLGPGAGAYLAMLAAASPGIKITALEANRTLVELCRLTLPGHDIRHADAADPQGLATVIAEVDPDFVTARYLLQHLPADVRSRMLSGLQSCIGSRRLICIEADDALFQMSPETEAISELNLQFQRWQADRGGDRFLGRRLAATLVNHGFTDVRATPVLVSSQEVGLRNWWGAYGSAYRRSFEDFEASGGDPIYLAAEAWIDAHADDRSVWISKIIHVVSGTGP